MNVTQKIKMDLLSKQNVQTVYAVRDDTNSRLVQISLFEGGVPWEVPSDAKIAIGYRSSNGASGVYDTLPDGEIASMYDGNKITISLVPVALYPGTTKVTVVIADENDNQISTFPLNVEVDENYSYGASEPENYINLRQWMSAELASLIDEIFHVDVFPAGEGYATEETMVEIQDAYESGRTVYCDLETEDQELLTLPMVKAEGGVCYFASVCDGVEWLVTITRDGEDNTVVHVTQRELGATAFWVTVTQDGGVFAADKTFAEIVEAHVAGQAVFCMLGNEYVLPLVVASDTSVAFQETLNREYHKVVIKSDDTITYKSDKYALLEELPAESLNGTNWTDPEAEETFGETGTEGEGGEEYNYVTDNLAAMYDFTQYDDGYQGEVEDLSGNGVVPTITGLNAYKSGRQGFVGGKLMMGDNTTAYQAGIDIVERCDMTVDCDAVKSHPYSIEVYGFLRKNFNDASPAGTLEYQNTSAPGWWNMMVAQTIYNGSSTVEGWSFVATENMLSLYGIGDSNKLEVTDVDLSIGGVNNSNVTGADTHLVYCVDGNQQKIYLNGVLVASAEGVADHGFDNLLKMFPLNLTADLKMFRLYKSVLSDFDVYSNYQQAVSDYSGVAEEDNVTRKDIKEMDNFPVTLARATYMNNSKTTVEEEINNLKNGNLNSAIVVSSAEVGDNGVVAFKNAAGITVFEADLAQMMPGALQLPRVYLSGSTVGMGKDSPVKMAFKFVDADQTITGWADAEWQGNTSLVFPIKNYGIDLYEDEAMETEMDISVLPHMATDSYHLKANYIDPSNTKNVAGARLFKYMCDTVGLTFPNSARCVVDGRPIEVYLNGTFNGIYTFNYKQSKSLFGMGDGDAEFIYRCEVNTGWGLFEGTSFPTKEEFDLIWEARYPKPKNLTHHDEIQRMLKWVNDATADEFKTNIGSYLNLQSCLIYLICGDIMAFRDNSAKNLTVCSWDGLVWYTIPYDMDMGMMDKADSGMESHGGNLWNKIDANFDAEKKALYAQLRDAGMDANTIFKLYSDILYPIGMNGYTADRKVKYDPYSNIDSRVSFVDFDDYIGFHKEFIQARIELMDEKYGYTA